MITQAQKTEMKKKLYRGDYTTISEKSGAKIKTVYAFFRTDSQNRKIIAATEEVLKGNIKLEKYLNDTFK